MRISTIALAFLFMLVFVLPQSVSAGDCFPVPTPSFKQYLNIAFMVTLVEVIGGLLIVNNLLLTFIYNRLNLASTKGRLAVFTGATTLISIICYGLWYWMILPNEGFEQLFSSSSIAREPLTLSNIISPVTLVAISTIFFNPLSIIGFTVTFFLNWLLLKKLLKVQKDTKKAAILTSLATFPLIGLTFAVIFKELYYYLFPFARDKWIPCR